MKATGIIQKIDDHGKMVIPKEVRRIARIREDDSFEIYIDEDGAIIFKKHSPSTTK